MKTESRMLGKKEANEMLDTMIESLRLTAPSASAVLAWRDAGCPEHLPSDVLNAFVDALKGAIEARETGVLWGMRIEEVADDGRDILQ